MSLPKELYAAKIVPYIRDPFSYFGPTTIDLQFITSLVVSDPLLFYHQSFLRELVGRDINNSVEVAIKEINELSVELPDQINANTDLISAIAAQVNLISLETTVRLDRHRVDINEINKELDEFFIDAENVTLKNIIDRLDTIDNSIISINANLNIINSIIPSSLVELNLKMEELEEKIEINSNRIDRKVPQVKINDEIKSGRTFTHDLIFYMNKTDQTHDFTLPIDLDIFKQQQIILEPEILPIKLVPELNYTINLTNSIRLDTGIDIYFYFEVKVGSDELSIFGIPLGYQGFYTASGLVNGLASLFIINLNTMKIKLDSGVPFGVGDECSFSVRINK